jgi:hypothetical protein
MLCCPTPIRALEDEHEGVAKDDGGNWENPSLVEQRDMRIEESDAYFWDKSETEPKVVVLGRWLADSSSGVQFWFGPLSSTQICYFSLLDKGSLPLSEAWEL